MATNLPYLSGDDPTFLPSLAVGGRGSVSVVSNLFPTAFVKIQESFNQGQVSEARKLQFLLTPLIHLLFCETNPTPLKAALEVLGLCKNQVRLPLAKVSSENEAKIAKEVHRVKSQLISQGLYDESK